MKRILITGANSYIGTSVESYLNSFAGQYDIDTVDMLSGSWKDKDFSVYDVVFHVAGIAHIKETAENADLYYKVNRDLVVETANKAKKDGVKHFVFLSSMSVYGIEKGSINKNTVPKPNSHYGKSKLQAERRIEKLNDDKFKVAILRPPMVYGKGCKGNYQRLRKFALGFPVFPDLKNQRSMIYIGNLCEFVKMMIDTVASGVFCPQNSEYVCTSDMVKLIADNNGKKIKKIRIFNPFIRVLPLSVVNKVFGNLTYEHFDIVDKYSLKESIELTEKL